MAGLVAHGRTQLPVQAVRGSACESPLGSCHVCAPGGGLGGGGGAGFRSPFSHHLYILSQMLTAAPR